MAYGRLYIGTFQNQSVSAAVDFFEIAVPSDATYELVEVRITQISEFGDAAQEQLRFTIKKGISANTGSGGTAMTLNKFSTGDAAAGSSWSRYINTTQIAAGGGSVTVLLEEDENIHNGWLHSPPEDRRFTFSPSETIAIGLAEAPDDAISFSGYIIVKEIGG